MRLRLLHEAVPMLSVCRLLICSAIAFGSHSAMAVDTGDAPASYGQATHTVVPGSPYLGDVEPDDNQPVAGESALGDDSDGLDDEGGVFAFPVLVQNGKSYDTNVFATNNTGADATLAGWVDFDGNGQFDADEFSTAVVPAGTDNAKFKLLWPDLSDISTEFAGTSYARFRITSGPLSAGDAQGPAIDGEIEDYSLDILLDTDGDEEPNITDDDNDNDGIPDLIEGLLVDTDGDSIPDYLDVDSDGDSIPDFIEAGSNPRSPSDTDNDGMPDYQDLDSNNDGTLDQDAVTGDADRDGISDILEGAADSDGDGVLDRDDLDADNDTIPDAIESGRDSVASGSPETGDLTPVDTDGDGIPDYLDRDSDNDGVPDIREANSGVLNVALIDADNDGQVDASALIGANGLVNVAETMVDSNVPIFAIADSDEDGIRDFRDLDSDGDGVSDLLETGGADTDGNGRVDSSQDTDQDGIVDGSNAQVTDGGLIDVDDDGVPDFQDDDANGSEPADPGTTPVPGGSTQNPPRVETGLSGGAGCSVSTYSAGALSGSSPGNAVSVLPILLLLSLLSLGYRRLRR